MQERFVRKEVGQLRYRMKMRVTGEGVGNSGFKDAKPLFQSLPTRESRVSRHWSFPRASA